MNTASQTSSAVKTELTKTRILFLVFFLHFLLFNFPLLSSSTKYKWRINGLIKTCSHTKRPRCMANMKITASKISAQLFHHTPYQRPYPSSQAKCGFLFGLVLSFGAMSLIKLCNRYSFFSSLAVRYFSPIVNCCLCLDAVSLHCFQILMRRIINKICILYASVSLSLSRSHSFYKCRADAWLLAVNTVTCIQIRHLLAASYIQQKFISRK